MSSIYSSTIRTVTGPLKFINNLVAVCSGDDNVGEGLMDLASPSLEEPTMVFPQLFINEPTRDVAQLMSKCVPELMDIVDDFEGQLDLDEDDAVAEGVLLGHVMGPAGGGVQALAPDQLDGRQLAPKHPLVQLDKQVLRHFFAHLDEWKRCQLGLRGRLGGWLGWLFRLAATTLGCCPFGLRFVAIARWDRFG